MEEAVVNMLKKGMDKTLIADWLEISIEKVLEIEERLEAKDVQYFRP